MHRFSQVDVFTDRLTTGNPLAVAAGLATLAELDAAAYARLRDLTRLLAEGLADAAGDHPVSVTAVPGLVTPFFAAEAPSDFAGSAACDHEAYGAFARALLDRGVYPPPSQYEAWFVSLAHDEAAIERTVDAAREAFAEGFQEN